MCILLKLFLFLLCIQVIGGDDRSIILQNIEVMLPVLEHTQVDPLVILRHPVLMTKIKNLQHFKCFLFFRNTAFWG